MSRTIHPVLPDDDDRWEMFDEVLNSPFVVLRWRRLELVCETVEYLCVDADPMREVLRHESGDNGGTPPRDLLLSRAETEELHAFAQEALDVLDEAYDVDTIFDHVRKGYDENSDVEPPEGKDEDIWQTWCKLDELQNLTDVALDIDVGLKLG